MPLVTSENIDRTIYDLKQKMARIDGGGVPQPSAVTTAANLQSMAPIPSPEWLSQCMDIGGVPRAAVTSVADCPAAHVDMIAATTRASGCVAIVGYPQLALAAIDASGGNLERLVVIPDPAPHAAAVVGTLLEGLDMVFYRPSVDVTPTFARPVEARLHKSQCALVVSGQTWPRAQMNIDVRVVGVTGLGRGSGRIRGIEVDGQVWGKSQPPRSFHAVLGDVDAHGISVGDATAPSLQEVAQ